RRPAACPHRRVPRAPGRDPGPARVDWALRTWNRSSRPPLSPWHGMRTGLRRSRTWLTPDAPFPRRGATSGSPPPQAGAVSMRILLLALLGAAAVAQESVPEGLAGTFDPVGPGDREAAIEAVVQEMPFWKRGI